jgi:subtilisin family serine protease
MRTPPRPENAWPLALVALAVTLVLVAAGGRSGAGSSPDASAVSWAGLAGAARPRVAIGQRMIVVLRTPSLAERVAAAGGVAADSDQHRWIAQARAAEQLVLSKLAVQGLSVTPDYTFERVLAGFSAALDPRAVAILERLDEVQGVYPVRAAYPASVSSQLLPDRDFRPGSGHRLDVTLPGFDGRGVTVALLDTGVDRAQPYLRGRIRDGVDLVGGSDLALAAPRPDNPAEIERHGTELAGILVGASGPADLSGVATGAWVLPIRVAGWQRAASGRYAVFARTDQVLAGLERAVDPNGDGVAHDAARIALVGLAEPYSAFADGPLARAVAGALKLDTLVVAPVGNDGVGVSRISLRDFGSVAGPGGAPQALTVGAVDLRRRARDVRVTVRAGLRLAFEGRVPLGGAVRPGAQLSLPLAAPLAGRSIPRRTAAAIESFFDEKGFSRVAGKAALVPGGESPQDAVENAARAGAGAVVLYGAGPVPSGSLGLDEDVPVPVVGVPRTAALRAIRALRQGADAAVSIGAMRMRANPGLRRVAAFSSGGLAFDGGVKPNVVAQGVGIATSEPGANDDGTSRFGTVNGSSAAAAVVAGAAALLAQARPSLDGPSLRSLLANAARPLAAGSVAVQGSGLLDVGASASTELAANPVALALGRADNVAWQTTAFVRIRNVSTRRLTVGVGVIQFRQGAADVSLSIKPSRFSLAPGGARRVSVLALAKNQPKGERPAEGVVVVQGSGSRSLRIPWAITFGAPSTNLLGAVQLSQRAFKPSDVSPALLTLRAGKVIRSSMGDEIRPVRRLDVDLLHANGERIGLLARLRDLIPGHIAIGITGRDPDGELLPNGVYRLRLTAWPTERTGAPSRTVVRFRIRGAG